jgi:hypothetical protein
MTPLRDLPADRVFNNADSFAQAFDEAWQRHCQQQGELEPNQRVEAVLALVADHPFQQEQPAMALQVAQFRIRLLGL